MVNLYYSGKTPGYIIYDSHICQIFPDLFGMALNKNIKVAEVINDPQAVIFSRWLVGQWRWVDWIISWAE